jgi:hypothetical protein
MPDEETIKNARLYRQLLCDKAYNTMIGELISYRPIDSLSVADMKWIASMTSRVVSTSLQDYEKEFIVA